MLRVAAIGECMIELNEDSPGLMRRSFGGDTLNTAIYLARSLRPEAAEVSYVTALGDDPFSDELLAGWLAEGVSTRFVLRLAGRLPGLYVIRTDGQGERTFHYWRSAAAARELFRAAPAGWLDQGLAGCDLVYLSGITLAIFDAASREALLALLRTLRAGGTRIAFDSNYRPRLWPDRAEARHWMDRAFALADFALPTFDDEQALFEDRTPDEAALRLHGLGVREAVIKLGAEGCLIGDAAGRRRVAAPPVGRVVDTTAAGDAFNAAYLAARLRSRPPPEAAQAGHALAGQVIQHKGAIIPA